MILIGYSQLQILYITGKFQLDKWFINSYNSSPFFGLLEVSFETPDTSELALSFLVGEQGSRYNQVRYSET